MSRIAIETPDGRMNFEPGSEVEVYLDWDLDQEAEAVELRLVWNTAGKGDTDVEVVDTQRFEYPSLRESRRATVVLPASPYSFSGTLVSLIWAFELIAMPEMISARQEIVIAPGGTEVQLNASQAGE